MTLGQDYDNKCDIFSLGIILYQLLTEEPPYGPNTPADIHIQVAHNPLLRPTVKEQYAKEHTSYVQLMQQCWSHDPTKRPTADQVCAALQEMMISMKI